jgi:beta-galactosidase
MVTSFPAGWLFGPATADSDQPGFDDSGLETITLPHTVTPLSWRNWDPRTWEQTWVYRKHFHAPVERARVFLDIEAALTSAAVVLNGHTLPGNTGGYLPFTVELTDYLSDGGNVLAITLDSRFNADVPPDRPAPANARSIDFWEPGGIYRDVKLRIVPAVFIADVFAKPVNVLNPDQRAVHVQCTLDGAPNPGDTITVDLLDGSRVISTTSVPVTTSQATLDGLADITLWDIDNPKLYTVRTALVRDGIALHEHRTRIGFREASFTLDGFFLNGNRVKLFGLCRHQFFPFAGGALPARVQRRDAEIMRRELNCNVVRCSHYPQSAAFLDACDELGLMVWDEIPGWGYFGDAAWQQAAYQDVQNMIIRDRNHPCVIVWGAMPNEAGAHAAQYSQYNDLAHALDDSRPTGGDSYPSDASFVFDVFTNHDYGSRTGPDGLRQPALVPPVDAAGKPYLICEAVGTLSGPALAYRRTSPQQLQQGLATAHAAVHDVSFSDDRHCGVIAWSGFDYLSDATGNCFGGVKYTGVVDLFRTLKPGAAIYQSQIDPELKPVIQPAFYWDFGSGYPVSSLPAAMICSNCDRLEVYVGGAHFATVAPDTQNYAHLPYPPSFTDFTGVDGSTRPELRIDGFLNGVQVASRRFSADPSGDRLAVTADHTELIADGSDATRVEFRAVDVHRNQRPYLRGEVRLAVTGPGVLVGDNPFAFGDAGGAGAVWIRTLPGSPGTITVRAEHPELGSATAVIEAIDADVAPVPAGALAARTSRTVITPGSTVTLTGSFTNNGRVELDRVALAAQLPSGWAATAASDITFGHVRSGQSVQANWQVTVPADAPPQTATITVLARFGGVAKASVPVQVPYASLPVSFSIIGVNGDFDGGGGSYSAEALAAAGLTPGGTVRTPDGLEYTWPEGQPDNALGSGQTVLVDGKPGATRLGLLAACTGGSCYGTVIVHYADGSSAIELVYLNDWTGGPNASGPDQGFTTFVAATKYVYAVTVPVDPARTVVAVTLPNRSDVLNTTVNAAHIFAVTTGTPVVYPSLAAAFNNTGISPDGAAGGADFDGAGYSYSAQALAAKGLAPGATVVHDGLSFSWPAVPAGQPDNVIAMGQTIAVSGTGSRLGFLGASSPNAVIGTGTVHYADGTASEYSFRLDDYWYAPGAENDPVAAVPYLNTVTGRYDHTAYVFYASVPVAPGREISAVTLPPNGANPPTGRRQGMHIFAVAVG